MVVLHKKLLAVIKRSGWPWVPRLEDRMVPGKRNETVPSLLQPAPIRHFAEVKSGLVGAALRGRPFFSGGSSKGGHGVPPLQLGCGR